MRAALVAALAVVFLVAAPADAATYYPCSIGGTDFGAWSKCPSRPSEKPGTTQFRVKGVACNSTGCWNVYGDWRDYGAGKSSIATTWPMSSYDTGYR